MISQLLKHDEPEAIGIERPESTSRLLLTCEHAGKRVPQKLNMLGLSDAEVGRHIGWDLGAFAVAQQLSQVFDATLVFQRYSRLVIDCNRQPGGPGSMLIESDGTPVPGNENLSDDDRMQRIEEIFNPYHSKIKQQLDLLEARHGGAVLLSVHSFTPVLRSQAEARPWHIGVLAGNHPRQLADSMIQVLNDETDLCIGDNQPYGVGQTNDYTIPVHGIERGVPHIEFEIRQDLIGDEQGQRRVAELLTDLIPRAVEKAGLE